MRRASQALILALATLISGCKKSGPATGTGSNPIVEAGPGVTSLLGGLKKGDPLGGATTVRIEAPIGGQIHIPIAEGETSGELVLTLQGSGPLPIATTKKYAIYSDSPRPGAKPMAGDTVARAIEALAERIRANEDKVPTPSGVTAYGAKSEPM
jgi:hypothetical protein